MQKEKTIKAHKRRTKSGKVVNVRRHTAKYDASEKLKESLRKKGSGEELKEKLSNIYEGFDFTEDDFLEWYEGTGSPADKRVAKELRELLGRKAYNELNDLAADYYKKGGANSFFKDNVKSVIPYVVNTRVTGEYSNKRGVNPLHLVDAIQNADEKRINYIKGKLEKRIAEEIAGDGGEKKAIETIGHYSDILKMGIPPVEREAFNWVVDTVRKEYYAIQTEGIKKEATDAVRRLKRGSISGWSTNFYAPSLHGIELFVKAVNKTLPSGASLEVKKHKVGKTMMYSLSLDVSHAYAEKHLANSYDY